MDDRRVLVGLALSFIALDVLALVLLGPISPSDSASEIADLYRDRRSLVLASRLVHSFGLTVAFGFFGLLCARLRQTEDGTLTRIIFGGFVALVPIEVVRNVMFAALALRFDDFGDAALPFHVVAVLLGPAIAFPVIASLTALAVLRRSGWILAVAIAWALSAVRLTTLDDVIWYGGLVAFVGLLAVLLHLSFRLPDPAPPAELSRS